VLKELLLARSDENIVGINVPWYLAASCTTLGERPLS
jgi:hypothetical protein